MAGYPTGCPFGLFSDQYTAIPTASGLKLGMRADAVDGSEKTFVKFGAAVAANKFVKLDDASFTVIPTSAATDMVFGAQDQLGATGASASYGWVTTYGPCTGLVAAGIAKNIVIEPETTSGQLKAATAGDEGSRNVVTTAASGAGGATTCFIR